MSRVFKSPAAASISHRLLALPPGLRYQAFSVLNRPPPNYPGHVPLTFLERTGLAVGSAIASMVDHYRHDMVAALGEATAQPFFIRRLRHAMLSHPTGRQILRDKPRLSSSTLDIPRLRALPRDTVGHAYVSWLDREHVSPDTRDPVRYIDDPEDAYVMQRYRECHDFSHALTGLPVIAEGEIALKAFEFANTVLPMTGLSLAALVRLKPEERERFWDVYGPWAVRNGLGAEEVICVYWEREMETKMADLRERLGVEQPPDLRAWRREVRKEKQRKLDEAKDAGRV
ncbi:Ubiquinone biosynthesis protein coq4, mitochondrial [Sphaceloma murrayae]|uniref:4-hydroxy-3-methoxy-5-polyprenylbenzoate decarboxylase n=1 Tax=Sphaceloma murrayae TaxID=2082308 RepID=A0A2K1QX29_9PEZI|nr:Ubiquinone biosynthesis protein coq4, mitochondrial [Sphaceloma murrayae]